MRPTTDDFVEPQYQRLLGNKTGIVNSVYAMQQGRGQPEAALSQPISCSVGWLADADGEVDLALGGKGETLRDTYMSSIGETVERYSLCFPKHEDEYVTGSYAELSEEASVVDFEYLDIYDESLRGDRLAPFDRDTRFKWVAGTNLLTGEDVYVPVELVTMINPVECGQERPRFLGTSNGAAAGSSLTHALLGSLYELIERDGFMKTWCRQESPSRIPLSSVPAAESAVEEFVTPDHLSVEPVAYDTPLDVAAVGGAIVNERDELPKFILGGGASVSAEEAVRHAVVESIQGFPFISDIAMKTDPESVDPASDDDTFEENVYYYALPENFEEVEFVVQGQPEPIEDDWDPATMDMADELDHCLEELDRLGYTPIAIEKTTPDVAQMGFRVTKVLVPELVPITPPATLPVGHPAFEGERDRLTDKPHPYA